MGLPVIAFLRPDISNADKVQDRAENAEAYDHKR